MPSNTPVVASILNHLDDLLYRDFLIEIFTLPDRSPVLVETSTQKTYIESESFPYVGKLVTDGGFFKRVSAYKKIPNKKAFYVSLEDTGIPYDPNEENPLITPHDTAIISTKEMINYKGDDVLITTIGRVIINYLLFVKPFGSILPYWDDIWSSGKLEATIADLLIQQKVTVQQMNTFVENLYFVGHSPELVAPNITEKSLMTDPNIKKIKADLMKTYGEAIENGDAAAMVAVEQALIKADKAYLEGDDSMRYLLKGKFFNTVRKKLWLTHGMVEQFGSSGQFNFIDNSLEEGWTQKNFPKIANEIRDGSYSRARETAKGGEDSKFILRVFQNTRVLEPDCGTKRTFDIEIRSDNAFDYLYRNYYDESGTQQTVSEDTFRQLVGKTVRFRSPMYCNTQGGYCYACMGKLFENTQQKVLATSIQSLTSSFLTASLKKVHGSSVSTINIDSLNEFILK